MRPRILIATGTLEVGGAEGQILEICRSPLADQFEFHVVTRSGKGALAGPLAESGAVLHSLSLRTSKPDISRLRRGIGFVRSVARLRRILRRLRPDLIHAYLFEMSVVATASRWPRRRPPLLISRRSLVEWIARDPIYYPLARWTNRRVDLILANSEAVSRDAVEKEGVSPARIRVIYNGVDTERFRPGPPLETLTCELDIAPGIPVVGMVANLHRYKGHVDMVEAAARLRDQGLEFTLLFVGRDGNASEDVRERIRELHLGQNIRFAGPRSDIDLLLRLMDVFVSASHEEGFSNSVLEAMASGRAVVATSVGGTAEQVKDGVTGFLVKPRDPEALCSAVGRLLRDPELRSRLGAAARSEAVHRFSLETLIERMSSLYREVIGKRDSGNVDTI